MDTSTTTIDAITAYWPVAAITLSAAVGIVATLLVARTMLSRQFLLRRSLVWLEITPPSRINKTPEATEQLFAVIHGTREARSFKEIILGRSPTFSFEITSTRKNGIRYLLQLEKERSKSIQQAITSYIPDSKVKEIDHTDIGADKVIEFKEKGHYILPLTLTSASELHDPLSYVTGAMTKLADGEQITLQMVATPIRMREAEILSLKILGNENILQQVGSGQLLGLGRLTNGLGKVSSSMTDLASEVLTGTASGYGNYYRSNSHTSQQQTEIKRTDRPSRSLSTFEQELMESMHRKVTQPLFQVDIRILVKSPEAARHIASMKSTLDGFSVPPYQSLKAKTPAPILNAYRYRLATRRLPSLMKRSSIILATSELASLYHFPSSQVSKTDNLIASLSRTLPAPVSLKSGRKLAITIGENHHHGTITTIGLTEEERERHMYIIGGTGNGKTTLLQYAIVQDIKAGKGVAIIDPHGDMAETILAHIPKERTKDVVYFNPDDLDHPFALNLLELSPKLTGNELLREKDIITESVVSVFRKIFSEDDSGGHRIEYVLRNTIHTALTVEHATIFTVLKLLQDPKYRRQVSSKLTDESLVDFWKNEIGKAGDMQKVKMSAGITAKIGRFNVNAATKTILSQPKSSIDFEEIMDSGKILICNFSKGLLGEDVSELFGITVLAKLQLASLRRARLKQLERKPYYLYVDEFQNFATPSFVQMLSESRKYRLFLTMAEQSTSQQKDQQIVGIILANVGTVVTFRTGNPQDEKLLLPMFSPYISEGEIANLDAFNFFVRLSSVKAQEPVSGRTLLLSEPENEVLAKLAIDESRKRYAVKRNPEKDVVKKSKGKSKKTVTTENNPERPASSIIKPPGHN